MVLGDVLGIISPVSFPRNGLVVELSKIYSAADRMSLPTFLTKQPGLPR